MKFVELLANDFDQHALLSSTVELAIEDLLPGTEIQLARGDGDDHFPAHHLPLQVRISIILARAVMAILPNRLMGRQLFEPLIIVVVEAGFVIVDEHGSRDVHGVHENQSLSNTAFPQALVHLRGDVEKGPAGWHVKPKLSAIALHDEPSISADVELADLGSNGWGGMRLGRLPEKVWLHLLASGGCTRLLGCGVSTLRCASFAGLPVSLRDGIGLLQKFAALGVAEVPAALAMEHF